MSKRIATPLEIKQMLQRSPWNNSNYNILDEKFRTEVVCSESASLTINFNNVMLLDEDRKPICPLDGIAVPKLAELLQVPFITADTKLLLGKFYSKDNVQNYHFNMGVLPKDATHFMIITKHSVSISDSKTLHPQQPWTQVYLRDVKDERDREDPGSAVMRIVTKADNMGNFWDFTVFPIGYCWPEAIDGKYHIHDDKGQEHIALTPGRLFPIMAAPMCRAYSDALGAYEQELDAHAAAKVREHKRLEDLCKDYTTRVDVLRNVDGFQNLEGGFTIYSDGQRIAQNNTICTPDAIDKWLSRLERKAVFYRHFCPQMELLRSRIEQAYGELNTSDPYYAEASFPVPSFGPKDPDKVVNRFSYSEIGYVELLRWLLQQEELIAEAKRWRQTTESGATPS